MPSSPSAAFGPRASSDPTYLWIAAGIILVLIVLVALTALGMGSTPFGANTVLVIPVKGEISNTADSFTNSFSADELVTELKSADDDPSISAIVLDIESPGGTVVATKQVVYQVRQTQKPIVSYIGEIGASGGYYIAASSDYIVSDEDSITGSIGVLTLVPDLNGLLQKLGIKIQVLQEGEFKTIGSPFRPLTQEESEILQSLVSQAGSHFKRDLLEFRNGKIDSVTFEKVADGRILSGLQAQKAGLVDELGPKQYAIDKAMKLSGGHGEPNIRYLEKESFSLFSFFSKAGFSFGHGFQSAFSASANTPQILARS